LRAKTFLKFVTIVSVLLFLTMGACEYTGVQQASEYDQIIKEADLYGGFSPAEINILPLTKIENSDEGQAIIRVYVSLLDEFGSQIKAPAIFRFELYEKISRAQEVKGRRVVIWPDFDLCRPGNNNNYWQDFLRAYKFDLNFKPQEHQSYVLQVTCLCLSGKRLTAETKFVAE